jgi:hypothetical protein
MPTRTPQQMVWDRRMGVTFDDGRIELPPNLIVAIDREADQKSEPALVKQQLAAVGGDYDDAATAATP